MAIANFTGDGGQKTVEELFCSVEFSKELLERLMCFTVVNIFLSITAFLGNALILVALHKEISLHPPSKLLYRNLATTDLCVGIIAEPLHVSLLISVVKERWGICRYAFVASHVSNYILGGVSLFTLTVISVDGLLALLLGFRYRHVVTLKRAYVTVLFAWFVSISGASIYFWNYVILLWYGYTVISLCLLISSISYAKIFLTLRHHQNQVQVIIHQEQPNQGIPLNIARYKKAVSSALWVQLAVVVCYLPHAMLKPSLTQKGLSSSPFTARVVTLILFFLNSSLNPILYCWKIREVRQAVKDTIRQLCYPPC